VSAAAVPLSVLVMTIALNMATRALLFVKVCRHSGFVRPIDSGVTRRIPTDVGIGFKAEKMEVSLDSPSVEG
jgi:hypothetical protein